MGGSYSTSEGMRISRIVLGGAVGEKEEYHLGYRYITN
jgi:hypothetical protein